MASRRQKTRSSVHHCQENYSCLQPNCEATVKCIECNTYQCDSCDISMHTNERHRYHDRERLKKTNPNDLCQEGQSAQCTAKNYADIWCVECKSGFCFTCDSNRHKQKRKSHQRYSFQSRTAAILEVRETEIVQGMSFLNVGEKQNCLHEAVLEDDDSFHSLSFQTHNLSDNFIGNGSISSQHSNGSKTSLPDIIDDMLMQPAQDLEKENYKDINGFLLIDTNEILQVNSADQFVDKLGCTRDDQVKVISIFGNTGDGKSHTLNFTFFGGKEMFKTSSSQQSCTVGAWAAFDPFHKAIIIDTEGLLGITINSNRRTRLLLKILAISDIIIYRTKAERLHDDLFHFLGDASRSYENHFIRELKSVLEKRGSQRGTSVLGPSVIIFHETIHTNTLNNDNHKKSPEDVLRQTFTELEVNYNAFSSLHYVGTRTETPPTDFKGLLDVVVKQLKDTTVRSHRKPLVIFQAIQVLNDKFTGDIERCMPASFPDQYFTCASKCLSCGCRCSKTMNHNKNDEYNEHEVGKKCKYQHQYENKIYLCKVCHDKGDTVMVVPKATSSKDSSWFGMANYAWSGYVLECYNCGIIYRSRQYWYGNQDPDKVSVRTEIRHVWPGINPVLMGTHNAAQRLVDGFSYMTGAIASVSAKPAKVVGHWVTDQIAPAYWVPNAKIKKCRKCDKLFSEELVIHHCRACGEGFCDDCSSKKRPVPERGWGIEAVRVCNKCYEGNQLSDSSNSEGGENSQVTLRKGAEVVGSTVATVVNYPLVALKESSRPSYWVPDHEIKQCCVCKEQFSEKLRIHHCRACGEGVCSNCSQSQKPVMSRGWDHPVRVCDRCAQKL